MPDLLPSADDLLARSVAAGRSLMGRLESELETYGVLTVEQKAVLLRSLDKVARMVTAISHELRLRLKDEERRLAAQGYSARRDLVLEWVEQLAPEQRSDFLAGLAGIVTPEPAAGPPQDK